MAVPAKGKVGGTFVRFLQSLERMLHHGKRMGDFCLIHFYAESIVVGFGWVAAILK